MAELIESPVISTNPSLRSELVLHEFKERKGPFLSVITRHMPARAELLRCNQISLEIQLEPDYEQIVMVDEAGQGWEYAQQMLVEACEQIKGKYVLILDDDDVMIDFQAITLMKDAAMQSPAAVIWRVKFCDLGVLPEDAYWKAAPACGHIGSCGFMVRADIFREEIGKIRGGYASDFELIAAVYAKHGDETAWLDEALCETMQRGHGL